MAETSIQMLSRLLREAGLEPRIEISYFSKEQLIDLVDAYAKEVLKLREQIRELEAANKDKI